MPITVDIIIKGVALCYVKGKPADANEIWKVLFPFDECHSVKFSYRIDDGVLVKVGHLARANCKVDINLSTPRTPTAEKTANFNSVLDLTKKTNPRKTHDKIKRKDDWSQKAVLLSISNAKMSVFDYMQDYLDEDIYLREKKNGASGRKELISEPLAHWLKARIVLSETETFNVICDGTNLITPPAATGDDVLYTLIFDNDCLDVRENKNDMDMFYKIIEEPTKTNRKFHITGESERSSGLRVIPPNLEDRKPCMAVTASDPNEPGGELP